jgi:hypothetical protein
LAKGGKVGKVALLKAHTRRIGKSKWVAEMAPKGSRAYDASFVTY